jgi:hypothetical protein
MDDVTLVRRSVTGPARGHHRRPGGLRGRAQRKKSAMVGAKGTSMRNRDGRPGG